MNEVAIIGIGRTEWGRFPDRDVEDLAREAILAALKDANLNWTDIQYIVGGIDPWSGFPGITSGSVVQANLGYLGIPCTSVWNACATGSYATDLGRSLILGGMYDTVLCFGSFKAHGGFFPTIGTADDPNNLDAQRFRLLGKTNPTMFAYQAMRRMHNFGMTEDDLVAIKVKNSKHGKSNPYARYKKEFTAEEVLQSPMLVYPLRLVRSCCLPAMALLL